MEALFRFSDLVGRFRVSVWDNHDPTSSCLQQDFDPNRLEEAISQLVGQPLFVGGPPERPANEIIVFEVWPDPPTGNVVWEGFQVHARGQRVILLHLVNQLTRETAASVLHLFHHFTERSYLGVLQDSSTAIDYTDPAADGDFFVRDGTHFNPAIITALRHAKGVRVLDLYTDQYYQDRFLTKIFDKALMGGLRIFSRT